MFSIERLAFTVAFLLTLASPARSEMLFYASFDKSQHADFAVGNRKASGRQRGNLTRFNGFVREAGCREG